MFGLLIFVGLLFFLYAALFSIYSIGWKRLPNWKATDTLLSQDTIPAKTKVSIIIPARNEEKNIGRCLTSILNNLYPKELLEIILIDDFSSDTTSDIAKEIITNTNGKVLHLKDFLSPNEKLNAYKKKALSIAIQQASGDLIITTDADCFCPQYWLSEIVSIYEHTHAKCIVAPVNFTPAGKKNWIYYFQSLDFMTMQGITAAGTHLHIGSMCNGANLAFEKTAFNEVGGYEGIDQIASGDDMLLLYKIKKHFEGGIRYLKSNRAIVETPCQPTFKAFINQRIRWASKSDKYEDKSMIAILAVVYLLNLSLLVLFFAALFSSQTATDILFFLEALILKTIVELFFLYPVAGFYKKKKELFWFPLLQPLHILYIISTGFLGKFGKYNWKDRMTQ